MNKYVSIIAIVAIASLEFAAICKGIDGKCLGLALVAIAGLGGYGLNWLLGKRQS